MKKIVIFLLLSTTFLTGCGNSTHETRYQDKGKVTFKNQNKNVHKNSGSISKESSASASSASASSTNNSTNTKESSSYPVPKNIKKSARYVAHGDLNLPKQFSYDSFGTKLTLDKIKKVDQTIINRPLQFQIKQVRLIKNEAKTAKAKKMVSTAFSNTGIGSTYYTLQIKYTIKNESNSTIIVGGLNYVKLSANYAGTPISNMVDSSAGKQIRAGKTINTTVVTLVPNNLANRLHSCSIQFSSAYSISGKSLSKDSLVTKIPF